MKGNPGKRRLIAEQLAEGEQTEDEKERAPAPRLEPPAYLTAEREKLFFQFVQESTTLARRTDTHALARWCVWLNHWVEAKLALDTHKEHFYETKSKHGNMLRQHPQWKRLSEAEAKLVTLEDRLALNIAARHSVLTRMFQMPTPPPAPEDGEQPEPEEQGSPLGFLSQAGKPN